MRDAGSDFNRRNFHKLTLAALTGMLAGTAGCEQANHSETKPEAAAPAKEADVAQADPAWHLCRGLNTCKGQGADEKNACAGQGTCASASVRHDCGGPNECKGQGGCGSDAGANACKGKGGCHVPLMDDAWKTVRKNFEAKMKKQEKKFGEAPASQKS
jgi:hypothetical protein